jgi:hypothetical protein
MSLPDDGQQAAMQDADLFTKHPPDNKQRLDQPGHIAACSTRSSGRLC